MVFGLGSYFAAFAGVAVLGLSIVFFLFTKINNIKVTNKKAAKIAEAIRSGAMTFLREEYKLFPFLLC